MFVSSTALLRLLGLQGGIAPSIDAPGEDVGKGR